MLLTHNDGRLARQVDKPRFVVRTEVRSPESSPQETTHSSVRWDGIEEADAAMSWTTRYPEGG